MDDPPEFDYQVDLKIEDIYLLHHCVEETFKNWPGAPARPAEEQEYLQKLKMQLFAMMADYQLENG